jgi:hypothetical protein
VENSTVRVSFDLKFKYVERTILRGSSRSPALDVVVTPFSEVSTDQLALSR